MLTNWCKVYKSVPKAVYQRTKYQTMYTIHCRFHPRLGRFFPMTDSSHCDMIHSSPTAVDFFDNDYAKKQQVAWKEFQENMDRCTGLRNLTEIMFKMLLNTINRSINQSLQMTQTKLYSNGSIFSSTHQLQYWSTE